MSKEGLTGKDFVGHILDAADRILQYTKGMSREDFFVDSLRQDAVIRNIEIIGEATNNLWRPIQILPADTLLFPSLRFTGCGTGLRMGILR
jgi:uncharacterized protein with HEPN domain